MSLKFAALGSLTVLSALGTTARADDQAQNLGPVGPHEPILTTFGRRSSAAEPKKPEAGVIKREARVCDRKLNPAFWRCLRSVAKSALGH
jgi:sirohydrochlorin ferrochelatase